MPTQPAVFFNKTFPAVFVATESGVNPDRVVSVPKPKHIHIETSKGSPAETSCANMYCGDWVDVQLKGSMFEFLLVLDRSFKIILPSVGFPLVLFKLNDSSVCTCN